MTNPPKPERNILQKDIVSEIIPELLEFFRRKNIRVTEDQTERIARRVEEISNYQPRVAIFGKTGSGKSSLCNSIFGEDVAEVSDTEACTRAPQEYLLRLSRDKSIVLIDVPGVGESEQRDEEYLDLYASLLPHVDLLLWVVKSDDRALSIDEQAWQELVSPFVDAGCPVFVVVNQVDKLNPVREWDAKANAPGPGQQKLIESKVTALGTLFGLTGEQIIPVSALEKYNIPTLVEAIVFALPDEKKLSFINAVTEEMASDAARSEAKRGFLAALGSFFSSAFERLKPYVPTIVEVLMVVLNKRRA